MKRYLLYIDILGFSEMVKNDKDKVRRLYEVINSLNAYKHDAFRTIVFSDTILIYSIITPTKPHDHQYLSMFACEFAQDLFYRLVGQSIYFRAIIDYDNFEHQDMFYNELFYGEALISCYEKEKQIKSIGLFITEKANEHQNIFATTKHNDNINFVFFQQDTQTASTRYNDFSSFSYFDLEDYDPESLVKETIIFKDIYEKMYSSKDPHVRVKFQNYWLSYKKQYPSLLTIWEQKGFNMNNIIESPRWKSLYKEQEDTLKNEWNTLLEPKSSSSKDVVVTNIRIYEDIVKDSFSKMMFAMEANRTPKSDGTDGYIITFDPDRLSFRNAMITIMFVGMWIEALFHLKMHGNYSNDKLKKKTKYEEKLKLMGIKDETLLNSAKLFQEERSDLASEEAHIKGKFMSVSAQKAASIAIGIMYSVSKQLDYDINCG